MVQHNEQARRVLDLAWAEAARFGHRYLGPEHLVLGVLTDSASGASRVLEAHGVDLPAARLALGQLADRGLVPGPRPSDAELLGTLGIDLETVRQSTERTFDRTAVGRAIREATRARRRGVGRVPRTPLVDPPMVIGQVLITLASRPGHSALRSSAPSCCCWASSPTSRRPGPGA